MRGLQRAVCLGERACHRRTCGEPGRVNGFVTANACIQETPATCQATPAHSRPVTPWMTQEKAQAVISRMPPMSFEDAYALIRRNLGQPPSFPVSAPAREQGNWLDPDGCGDFQTGGQEHDFKLVGNPYPQRIMRVAKDGCGFYPHAPPIRHISPGTPLQYFTWLLLVGRLIPELGYRLEGFTRLHGQFTSGSFRGVPSPQKPAMTAESSSPPDRAFVSAARLSKPPSQPVRRPVDGMVSPRGKHRGLRCQACQHFHLGGHALSRRCDSGAAGRTAD